MSFSFREVRRENVPLLLGVAGGTGSGKTFSALLLARGISGGQPFAVVDTENGRAKHYADLFPEMRHGEIHAPFRPDKYADAITAGAAEYPVVVVDSASHEWAGDGGCLDWHDELAGGDPKKNLSAWLEPKRSHKRMVTKLLQVGAHVILCFRAEPKVEAVRENGQTVIKPKASLTGLDGWLPISEKMLPYELTASFLLMADTPGVPKPIKLPEQLKSFVALDRPLNEETGRLLAGWAAGSNTGAVQGSSPAHGDPQHEQTSTGSPGFAVEAKVTELLELAARISDDAHDIAVGAIAAKRDGGSLTVRWLDAQIVKARAKLPAEDPAESQFAAMLPDAVKGGRGA